MATSIDRLTCRRALRVIMAIVAVNAVVFIALRVARIISPDAAASILSALALPASVAEAAARPWTLLTYSVTQYDELHVVLNMLWLAWFGLILAEAGARRVWLAATYVGGALAAAAGYLILETAAHAGGSLIGSSGGVMAVVAAAAFFTPRTRVDLPLLRSVGVGIVATVIFVIDITALAFDTPGSHIAHIAGIAAGAVAGLAMRRLSRAPEAPAVEASTAAGSAADASLLEKLRTSGYDSLSPAERDRLLALSASNDNNQSTTTTS